MGSAMQVDPELMHSGAEVTTRAGKGCLSAAEKLAGATVARGIFGDFAAAHSFQSTARIRHSEHVALLHQHHQVLSTIAEKAHTAPL